MNSTPTGGSATPSSDDDEPGVPEVEDPPAEEVGGAAPFVPAPRSGLQPLPRRARPRAEPRHARDEPDTEPLHDPDGRRYTAPDPATLDRLLTGLRDI